MPILKTVKQFVHDNPWTTESGLRHLIFEHAPVNRHNPASDHALQSAVIRVGRKVLIDEAALIEGLRRISNG